MSAPSTWIVAGGGFGGICAAYFLARAGHRTYLVDEGPVFGGILNGFEWNGFRLDVGCQVLDNKDPEVAEILLDLLHGEFQPVEHRIASITAGTKTEGIELPDLSAFGPDVCERILDELKVAVLKPDCANTGSLKDRILARFGPTAAQKITPMVERLFGAGAETLAPEALELTPFYRLKFLDDERARQLKQVEVFDDRVAASKIYGVGSDKIGSHLFYPAVGGMRGFFESARRHLEELGVECLVGKKISGFEASKDAAKVTLADGAGIRGDRLFWASGLMRLGETFGLPSVPALRDAVHPMPLVIFYFAIEEDQEGPYCYVHNFDEGNMTFRGSTPSAYGEGIAPPGMGYACAEIYTQKDSAFWNFAEAHSSCVWSELRDFGVVNGGEPQDVLVKKAPFSNWRLPKPSFAQAKACLQSEAAATGMVVYDDFMLGRTEAIKSVKHALDGAL